MDRNIEFDFFPPLKSRDSQQLTPWSKVYDFLQISQRNFTIFDTWGLF